MENSTLFQQIKKTGLSEAQTIKTLSVVADYAKEKYPILEGNINSYLRNEFRQADPEILCQLFDEN